MKKTLTKIMSITTAILISVGAGACSDNTDSGGNGNMQYDKRNLTPQQYSVANLTAIDDYGRTVTVVNPENSEERYVGMFYFAWLGSQGMSGIYDVNKLEKENPSALYAKTDPNSPGDQFHFASEPLYGYYSMRDPWVIARHIELFTMAGLDYLLFDYTNSVAYNDIADLVLTTLKKFMDQGWDVPKVGFYTNSASKTTVNNVYNTFYKSGKYDEKLWFRFKGDDRPVIVGTSTANGGATDQTVASEFIDTESAIYKYFNFYESQWPSSDNINEEKGFPWMQWGSSFPNNNGNMSVSVAQHSKNSVFYSDMLPNSSRGFNGDTVETDWKKGANAQRLWDSAHKYASKGLAKNVFLTGWNEWTAIKYYCGCSWKGIPTTPSGYTGREIWFVDEYNAEYSRDIEPGKVFGDNFYMQAVENLRKFKFKDAQKYKMKTKSFADITDLSGWETVFTEYADFIGDAMERDAENAANVAHSYIDKSNRNDIAKIKVINDDSNIYLYVETVDDITEYNGTDKNWMNVLISAGTVDKSFSGFNFIINRSPENNGKTSIEKATSNNFEWENIGTADYFISGNKMVYKIPISALGVNLSDVSFSFKICDNITNQADILDYYVSGDSAPIGRFGYAYGK